MRRLLNIRPGSGGRFALGFVPLFGLAVTYTVASATRHEDTGTSVLMASE